MLYCQKFQKSKCKTKVGDQVFMTCWFHRLRASRLAELETILAILVDINDLDNTVLAMIENLQRQNLHSFEEAIGFQNLIGDYVFIQEALAQRIGKNQTTIANNLRLLRLPRAVQKQIIENKLSERHKRVILKLDNENDQLQALAKSIQENQNVSKTEELIEKPTRCPEKNIPFKVYMRDIRILTNTIQEKLEAVRRSGMET